MLPLPVRTLLVAVLILCLSGTGYAQEAVKLEEFLGRLGLADLQIAHLEQQLNLPAADKQAIAKKLADLYSASLLDLSDDSAKYQDLFRRIQTLVGAYPEANTPALRVIVLQAHFQRAEGQASKWLADPAATADRDAALDLLGRIGPALIQQQAELNSTVEKLAAANDKLPEEQRARQDEELRKIQVVAARATYVAGWATYYLGLLKGDAGKELFKEARKVFRKFLFIDEAEEYGKLNAESLGLETELRVRALVGLGLTEAAAGDLAASKACFKILDSAAVAPNLRDQAANYYLQGLLNAGKLVEAKQLAVEQVDAFRGEATQGKVSFCASLVRALPARVGTPGEADAKELARLGVLGLVKLRQAGIAQQLAEKHKLDLGDQQGFFFQWLAAQSLYSRAETSRKPEDYRTAADAIRKALAAPDAGSAASVAADARYYLGWCQYRQGEFEAAAASFQQSAEGRKTADPSAAADSAWMGFVAWQQLAGKESRYADAAIKVLEAIKRDYPESSYAAKADYNIARLREKASTPEQAIAQLSKVPPTDPSYLPARYDLAQIQHRLWADASGDRSAAAAKVRAAVDQFLTAAARDADQERKVRTGLLAVEVLLAATPPDVAAAAQYLRQAADASTSLAARNSAVQEVHFFQLQLAQKQNDAATASREAQWLVENAAGTRFETAALVIVARAADEAAQNAPAADRKVRNQEALEVYRRLVRIYGDSSAAIAAKKNALVANSKLAHYAYELGQYPEAADRLAAILAAYPKEQSYLRRAGLAFFAAGKFAAAIDPWRTLLAGVASGSPEWHEAKYYQIACLAKTNAKEAAEVLKQYRTLHGDSAPAPWRDKIKELEQSLPR